MASENTVNFKAFLQINGQKVEVRRFAIDKDVVTNFCYLQEKLNSVFPSLKNAAIKICWRDSEEDEIAISTDEELLIALYEMQGQELKKIYVANDHSMQKSQRAIHVGVLCDGCDRDLVGYRYKCVMCPDFDLCGTCESIGVHPEHLMLRIPTPTLNLGRGFGRKFGRWSCKLNRRFGPPMHQKSQESGSPCRGSKGEATSGMRCPGPSVDPTCLAPRPSSAGEATSVGGAPRCLLTGGNGGETWLENLNTLLNDIIPPAPELQRAAGSNDANILWNIRQGIASFLDPLGSCNTAASQNNGPTQMDHQAGEPTQKNESKDAKSDKTVEVMETEEVSNGTPVANTTNTQGKNSPITSEQPLSNQAPKGNVAAPNQPEKIYPDVSQMTTQPSSSRASPPPDPSWTVIDKVQSPDSNQPKQSPSAPPTFKDFHTTPRVEDALGKMLSMGFNNEGDWLRQMLIAKGGDIEQVLDTLMPIRKYTPK